VDVSVDKAGEQGRAPQVDDLRPLAAQGFDARPVADENDPAVRHRHGLRCRRLLRAGVDRSAPEDGVGRLRLGGQRRQEQDEGGGAGRELEHRRRLLRAHRPSNGFAAGRRRRFKPCHFSNGR